MRRHALILLLAALVAAFVVLLAALAALFVVPALAAPASASTLAVSYQWAQPAGPLLAARDSSGHGLDAARETGAAVVGGGQAILREAVLVSPASPLLNPGDQDVTLGVRFTGQPVANTAAHLAQLGTSGMAGKIKLEAWCYTRSGVVCSTTAPGRRMVPKCEVDGSAGKLMQVWPEVDLQDGIARNIICRKTADGLGMYVSGWWRWRHGAVGTVDTDGPFSIGGKSSWRDARYEETLDAGAFGPVTLAVG